MFEREHRRWLLTTIFFYRNAPTPTCRSLGSGESGKAPSSCTKPLQVARSRMLSRHAGSVRGGDCGSRKTPRLWMEGWMTKLDFGYWGQRLQGPHARSSPRSSTRRQLLEQRGACACAGPPARWAAARRITSCSGAPAPCAGPPSRWAAARRITSCRYACSPRPPPLVCGLSTCDSDRVCHGVDVVRCRQNALANAPFPLPVFCPLDNIRLAEKRKLADLTAHVSPDCLARALEIMERIWREGEEHMAKLSVNALIGP